MLAPASKPSTRSSTLRRDKETSALSEQEFGGKLLRPAHGGPQFSRISSARQTRCFCTRAAPRHGLTDAIQGIAQPSLLTRRLILSCATCPVPRQARDSGPRSRCYHALMAGTATLPHPKAGAAPGQIEEYPYSDGRILMEADPHANAIVEMRNKLRHHFAAAGNIYVAGSMAVYFREGDPQAVVAPDIFVVLGVEKRERRSYKIWEEGGVVPTLVIEVASPSARRLDATGKQGTYERMGVSEYWRFDPDGRQIPQELEGWRLDGLQYRPVAASRQAGGARTYRSEVLGLDLRAEGGLLRFRDPQTGQDLLTYHETHDARETAERRADTAERRADNAERKVDAEAVARRDAERRADTAERRADTAEGRAEAERVARRRAEHERDQLNRRVLELEARSRVPE